MYTKEGYRAVAVLQKAAPAKPSNSRIDILYTTVILHSTPLSALQKCKIYFTQIHEVEIFIFGAGRVLRLFQDCLRVLVFVCIHSTGSFTVADANEQRVQIQAIIL